MATSFLATLPLARARFVATVMVGAYLIINTLFLIVGPFTTGWPVVATTAVLVPPMVLAMLHLVIPLARRLERRPS